MNQTPLDRLSPHPVMLAPMVGLTHYAVRRGIQHFLPEGARVLWPTEMLNSRRIPSQHVNEAPEINFLDRDYGLIPQLLANEEEFIRLSVPRLESWGASAIDINMGCPVEKALKHNYGVALMGDPEYAQSVVRFTVQNAKVPVSVKLRAGLEGQDFDYLYQFVGGLFDAGASWVTIHPRTAEQKRKGAANWNLIKRLKQEFRFSGKSREIIGNGDVQCFDDIRAMVDESDCDRVMVGRAMVAKPWLIRNEPDPDLETQGAWYGEFLLQVLFEMREHYSWAQGSRRMKFLIVWGKPWVQFGEFLQGRVQASTNYEELEAAIQKFFSQKQQMVKRTTLRG
jgi:tRNA-dihydrouridine synthase